MQPSSTNINTCGLSTPQYLFGRLIPHLQLRSKRKKTLLKFALKTNVYYVILYNRYFCIVMLFVMFKLLGIINIVTFILYPESIFIYKLLLGLIYSSKYYCKFGCECTVFQLFMFQLYLLFSKRMGPIDGEIGSGTYTIIYLSNLFLFLY